MLTYAQGGGFLAGYQLELAIFQRFEKWLKTEARKKA